MMGVPPDPFRGGNYGQGPRERNNRPGGNFREKKREASAKPDSRSAYGRGRRGRSRDK